MNGKLIDVIKTFHNTYRVTFEVDCIDDLPQEQAKLWITVKKESSKRSLNANAYFHSLVGKIAEKNRTSKAFAKNLLLGRYGQEETINGERYIISTLSDIPMLEREDIHCKPIGYGMTNGKQFTHYCVIKPTHEYNTKEMSVLIDGTVEEAKELGIETMSPADIERMKSLWNGKT